MRTLPTAFAVSMAASLLLAPAAAPAFATDSTYTVPLHQQDDLPATASSAPVPHESDCPVPAGMDGWHFVLPGNSTHFVKLTVTFQPGGQQVITSFGPPSDKHAYAASQPGAQLTSAVAEVEGGQVEWFNLSHTCPADTTPTTSATPTPTPTPTTTTPAGTGGTGGTGGTSASPTPSATSTGSPSQSPTAPSGSSGGSPSPTPTASSTSASGDLADTGTSSATGWLAGAALALVAGGGFMVLRHRKPRQH
jgi:LPXTG-motif cell wall-anchored protein